MNDGSGRRGLSDGAGTATWSDLLSGQDLRQLHAVAARWADPGRSDESLRELTEEALSAAVLSYDVGAQPDFLVHALATLRRHLREARRSLAGPARAV
jgi:hypothetical protein